MKLDDLREYGLPPRLIDSWRDRQGERLLSIQRKAIQRGILGAKGDSRFLICAPTGSGKSFCAEMALARALFDRRKVVLVFPLKALAEQKYRQLDRTYKPLGLRVIISTADRPEFESAFRRTDYDVAVTIYEKLDRQLTTNLDLLQNVGLVVVDELQTVFEPGRGESLERLLMKLTRAAYQPGLIGLSAVISEGSETGRVLARWLDAALIEDSVRPVDLLRGVAVGDGWRFRSFNTGSEGEERFSVDESREGFTAVLDSIVSSDEPTLVFLKSRRETVSAALEAASHLNWPRATASLEALAEEEPSYLTRTLRQVLSRGVAFHNSDLTQKQRMTVEEGFLNGEIRLIISTTTLSVGVDLPASTVYLETVKYSSGCYDTRPVLVPISRAEFDNMSGRAGRLVAQEDGRPGRAVVIARSEFERDILWQNYIKPGKDGLLDSPERGMTKADWFLDMLVSGIIDSADKAREMWSMRLNRSCVSKTAHIPLGGVVEVLLEGSLVESTNQADHYAPTPLGRAVALAGLTVDQSRYYLSRLASDFPVHVSEWLLLAISVPGVHFPPGLLLQHDYTSRIPESMAAQRLVESHTMRWLGRSNDSAAPLSYDQCRTLKAFLILDDWRKGETAQILEERFQIALGQIQHLGETAAYLLAAVLRLAACKNGLADLESEHPGWLFSVRYGLPPSMAGCFFRFREHLSRADFLALYRSGIHSLSDLLAVSVTELGSLGLSDLKTQRIIEQTQSLKVEVDMEQVVSREHTLGPRTLNIVSIPQSIEIDGGTDGERYTVKIDGFPVRLTGKSFKYFTKLAWSRVNRDGGWIYKEDIEVGFNQARYLYRMKHEVADAIGAAWPIYENNRLGYYRLMIDPSRIKLNCAQLREHSDYEVRSLFESGRGRSVN